MNADGSGQRNLTWNAAHDGGGSWSPDGRKIVFYSSRDGNNEIYVMNADGSGQRILVAEPVDRRVQPGLVSRRADDRASPPTATATGRSTR